MPTGYTVYIEDGSITTGKEFLELCSRAFGVAIDLKDEPLSVPTPEYVEPDIYYKNRYTKAVAALHTALSMTSEEARREMRRSHEEKVSYAKAYLAKLEEKNRIYAVVREQVESWLPPTKDHVGIKDFALNQIDICMDSDEHLDKIRKEASSVLDDSDAAVAKYIEQHIEFCKEEVEMARKAWEAELHRTESRNEFMRQFIDSLKNMK